ncbi:hypothetical protein ACJX0J_040747, partial [Zea mays]
TSIATPLDVVEKPERGFGSVMPNLYFNIFILFYSLVVELPQIPLGVGEKPKRGFGSAMLKNLMFAVEKVKVAREIEVEGAYLKIYCLILIVTKGNNVAVICQIMASTPNVSQDHNKGNMKVSQICL